MTPSLYIVSSKRAVGEIPVGTAAAGRTTSQLRAQVRHNGSAI